MKLRFLLMSTWVGSAAPAPSPSAPGLAGTRGPEDASRTQSGSRPRQPLLLSKEPAGHAVRGPHPASVSPVKSSPSCLPVALSPSPTREGCKRGRGGSTSRSLEPAGCPAPRAARSLTAVAMLLHIPQCSRGSPETASPPPLPAAESPSPGGALHSSWQARWWGDHDGGPGACPAWGAHPRSPTRAAALLQGASARVQF